MNTKSSLRSKTLGRTSAVTVSRRNNSASHWLVAAGLFGMLSTAQAVERIQTASAGNGDINWDESGVGNPLLPTYSKTISGNIGTPSSKSWNTNDDFTFTGNTGSGVNIVLTNSGIISSGDFQVGTLKFDSTGFTVSSTPGGLIGPGGLLTYTANISVNEIKVTNAGDTATIASVISGTGATGLQKTGDGTLVLTNTNSWTGGTTVSAGTLQLGSATTAGGSLGNGSVNLVTSSSVLAMADSATRTLSNVITGAGQVQQTGTGTTTLSVANNYSGGTTVSAGKLIAGSTSALGSGAVSVNGGTLQTTVANVNTGALTLSSGSLSLNGTTAGSVTLASGANLLMSGGTWNLGLATNTDSIKGSGGATFSITGGTLDLGGGAINYGASYTLISGFNSGAVSGLNITNYNTALYTAVLGNNGVLSFTPVPEPSTYGLIGAGVLAAIALVRRRKKHAH